MKDVSTDLILRYGLQALSAMVILIVGIFIAKWVGTVAHQRLTRVEMEPPVRMLLARIVKILVLTLMIVLDQVGVPIAPLIAGVGVAGLGVGFALQGILSNVMAGLSIIFMKPYRVGEHISLLGVHGDVVTIDIFSTTLPVPRRHSQSENCRRDPPQLRDDSTIECERGRLLSHRFEPGARNREGSPRKKYPGAEGAARFRTRESIRRLSDYDLGSALGACA